MGFVNIVIESQESDLFNPIENMILRKNTYCWYYGKIPRHSNVTTSVLYETNWLIIRYHVWCTCALNLFVLLRLHVPCGLMSCLQFNLYSILPVVEMWSRLQVASGMQLTEASMRLETNENLLFLYRDRNKKTPKNLPAITLSYSQGKWRPCILAALQEDFTYFKMFPLPTVFSLQD